MSSPAPPTGTPSGSPGLHSSQQSAFRPLHSPPPAPIALPAAAVASAAAAGPTGASTGSQTLAAAHQTGAPASLAPSSCSDATSPAHADAQAQTPFARTAASLSASPLPITRHSPTRALPVQPAPSPHAAAAAAAAAAAGVVSHAQQAHFTRAPASTIPPTQQPQTQPPPAQAHPPPQPSPLGQSRKASTGAVSRSSSAVAPTPSPPQSERSSPTTVSGAREQGGGYAPPAPLIPAVPSAYPITHALPVLLPPPQFIQVEPFLYRCGRFHEPHLPFLASLHLKSLVYLSNPSEHPLSTTVKAWAHEHGVELLNLGALLFGGAAAAGLLDGEGSGWSDTSASSSTAFLTVYSDLIRIALEHVLLESNAPCMLVCHSGVELTSLVVGCLRRLQGWSYTSVLDEFIRSTCAQQLREDERRGGMGHKGAGMVGHASLTPGGIAGPLRYASTPNLSNDLQRHYRLEELCELFDLSSVRVPGYAGGDGSRPDDATLRRKDTPSTLDLTQQQGRAGVEQQCVEWFRRQKAAERREQRAQRRIRQQRQQAVQLPTALLPSATAIATATPASSLPHARNDATCDIGTAPLIAAALPPAADTGVSGPPPPPLSQSQPLSLAPWSSSLMGTYLSSRLVSPGVRFDKESLMDEDED